MVLQVEVWSDLHTEGQRTDIIYGNPQDNLFDSVQTILGVRPTALQLHTNVILSAVDTFSDLPSYCPNLVCATRKKVFFLGLVAPESCATATYPSDATLQSRRDFRSVLVAQQAAGLIWLMEWPFAAGQHSNISTQFHTVQYFQMWLTGVGAIQGAAHPDSAEIIAF